MNFLDLFLFNSVKDLISLDSSYNHEKKSTVLKQLYSQKS